MRSGASWGCSARTSDRLAARVGNLDRHFGQAQADLAEVRISTERASARARRLEDIEFGPDAPETLAAPADSERITVIRGSSA